MVISCCINFDVVGPKADPCAESDADPTERPKQAMSRHIPHLGTVISNLQAFLSHKSYQAGDQASKVIGQDLYLPRRREFGRFCRVCLYLSPRFFTGRLVIHQPLLST